MRYRFQHHYTREEARRLIPQLTRWLEALDQARHTLERSGPRLDKMLSLGCETGGTLTQSYLTSFLDMRALLREFSSREILVKDLERGLIDFPSILAGKEVFLCWERGEQDVEYWHDLDSGYAGREEIED